MVHRHLLYDEADQNGDGYITTDEVELFDKNYVVK